MLQLTMEKWLIKINSNTSVSRQANDASTTTNIQISNSSSSDVNATSSCVDGSSNSDPIDNSIKTSQKPSTALVL